MTEQSPGQPDERFVSWKRIAQYLQCSERTARRWAAEEGLPVHRHTGGAQSSVFAWRTELDAWLKKWPEGAGGPAPAGPAVARGEAGKAKRRSGRFTVSPRAWVAAALLGLGLTAGFAIMGRDAKSRNFPPIAHGRVETSAFYVIGPPADKTNLAEFARSLEESVHAAMSGNGIETAIREPGPPRFMAELEVKAAVERDENELRVTVHMLHKPSGARLWSGNFTRSAMEASRLRDQVASTAARTLRCVFAIRDEDLGMAHKVFAAYLHFCAAATAPSGHGVHLSAHARALMEADPGSTKARSIYAFTLANTFVNAGAPHVMKTSNGDLAKRLAQDVLAEDPQNSLAHRTMSLLQKRDGNWAGAERSLRMAMSGRWPRNWWPAAHSLAHHMRQAGRTREAGSIYRERIAADPFDAFSHMKLAWELVMTGFGELGQWHFDRADQLKLDGREIKQRRFELDLFFGDAGKALALLDSRPDPPFQPSNEQRECYRTFARARMNAADIPAVAAACAGTQADWRARMFAILGDMDRAYAAAGEFGPEETGVTVIFFYRGMEEFRRDARFFPLAAKFGLVDYWLETDKWPDFCAEKDLPFDCRERARAAAG
jgi:hypothetical protein